MAHDLDLYAFELPAIKEFLSGDDRTLAFQVVDSDGNAIDISGATVEWRLFEREYETGDSAAVLKGSDADVELVTDNRVDTTNGEWEIRVDGEATDELYGEYHHRPRVVQSDDTEASWKGSIIISA